VPTVQDLRRQLGQGAMESRPSQELDEAVRASYRRHLSQETHRPGHRGRKVAARSLGLLIVAGGGTLITGFASPAVANELQHLPLIDGIADALYAGALPGVESAVHDGFNIPINQSITHQGITVTLTNAYYGPDQLWIGMTESFAKNAATHPVINVGWLKVALDGKPPGSFGIGFQPMANGQYAGTIGIETLPPALPSDVIAQVRVTRIGNIHANWSFHVPLSRKAATSATTWLYPHVSKTYSGTTWRIDQVELSPASVHLFGELTTPGQAFPDFEGVRILATSSTPYANMLLVNSIIEVGHTRTSSTWRYTLSGISPLSTPATLRLEPEFNGVDTIQVPLHDATFSPNEYTFYPGTPRQMTVTNLTRTNGYIEVYYQTRQQKYARGNFYQLALWNGKFLQAQRYAYPATVRTVSRQKDEQELIFKVGPGWQNAAVIYYPAGHPTDPYGHSQGIVSYPVYAPNLTLTLPVNAK